MISTKSLTGLIVLFLAAFDPQVPFLPTGFGFTSLIAVLLFPFVWWILKYRPSNTSFFLKKANPYFIVFYLSLFFIILRIILNEGGNIEFILSWVKAFFVFLACLFTYVIFFANKPSDSFIFSLLTVYILNAVINLAAGSYPEVFSFLSMFRGLEISEELGLNPYRNSFISGSGFYSIGTAYGLITLLFSFHITNSHTKNMITFLSLAVIAITGFIAARTAFFAIISAFLYMSKSRFLYSALLALLSVLVVSFVLSLPALQPYKLWMLSFFDLANESSASYLIDQMYFWPGSSVFLIGMGSVNDGTYTFTDGGYMIDILFGGVFFLIIKLSFLLIFIVNFFKKYILFTVLFSLVVLLFHFKGLFLYNNAQGMAAFYFTFLYLTSIKKKEFLNN